MPSLRMSASDFVSVLSSPMNTPAQPGRPRQPRQLIVVAEVDRDLRDPLLVEPRRGHRSEEIEAALLRLAREAVQIVVDEDDVALRDGGDFRHDLVDLAHAEQPAVERGDRAERAVHRTAARGLRGDVLVAVLLEDPAIRQEHACRRWCRRRSAAQRGRPRRPRSTAGQSVSHSPTNSASAYCAASSGHERRVDAAHDDRNAARSRNWAAI